MTSTATLIKFGLKYVLPLLMEQNQPQQSGSVTTVRVLSARNSALASVKAKEGSVTVSIGGRDSGKTTLAYRLAEYFGRPTYAVTPEQAPPSWVKRLQPDEILDMLAPNSTLICDDLPAWASNRDYNETFVRELERMIPMVRHEKKVHLIFCTQSAAQADKYILDCDLAFFKPLGLLMGGQERPSVDKIYKEKVNQYFQGKDDMFVKKHAYMLSRSYEGLISIAKTN